MHKKGVCKKYAQESARNESIHKKVRAKLYAQKGRLKKVGTKKDMCKKYAQERVRYKNMHKKISAKSYAQKGKFKKVCAKM